ncbi:MAG: carboxymuconolactone decarboxylase family protein [Pseudomonadota bacterium]
MTKSIKDYADSYVELFGHMPPMPDGRFKLLADLDPEALLTGERLREKAFYSDVFDGKQTQLTLFGMLLIQGHPAAEHHAKAALREGASWEELAKIVELASVTGYLFSANRGFSMLNGLREQGKDPAKADAKS